MKKEPTKDEMVLGFASLDLSQLKEWAEEVAGRWNGDNPGLDEDRAHCAVEIKEKIEEIEELLKEMAELN